MKSYQSMPPTRASSDTSYAVGGTRQLPVFRTQTATRTASARYRRLAYSRAASRAGARHRARGRHRLIAALGAMALVAFAVAGVLGSGPLSSLAGLGGMAGRVEEGIARVLGVSPTSTPIADWRAGEVPELYQTDPAWEDEPYAGGTVGVNGCGPTCLSMAYIALTGRTDRDPAVMAAFSERGGYTVDGMTARTLMTEGVQALGLASEELPASADRIREALAAGAVIIASVRPGDFTTTGHFIVLAGIADNGELVIRDPNSAERTHETWSIERVLGQCANLWALSV